MMMCSSQHSAYERSDEAERSSPIVVSRWLTSRLDANDGGVLSATGQETLPGESRRWLGIERNHLPQLSSNRPFNMANAGSTRVF